MRDSGEADPTEIPGLLPGYFRFIIQGDQDMTVGICDDEISMIDRIEDICKRFPGTDERIVTKRLLSGDEVLECKDDIDILLLDIDMPGIDGIQIKNHLDGTHVLIIFVTNHEERMREAFGTNVFAFVNKEKLEEEIPFFVSKAIEKINNSCSLDDGRGNVIESRHVLYILSDSNYLRIITDHTDGEEYLVRDSLIYLEQKLSKYGFVRISRNCMVNLNKTDKITDSYVIMGEMKFKISVRRKTTVKRAIKDYNRKMMRYQ